MLTVAVRLWGDDGGRHWLVRMECRPAGWSVCLPLLIFPCTVKSRSSLLAPAHADGPGKRDVKLQLTNWWWLTVAVTRFSFDNNATPYVLPVLWMTSCLPITDHAEATPVGRIFKVTHQAAAPGTKCDVCKCLVGWLAAWCSG